MSAQAIDAAAKVLRERNSEIEWGSRSIARAAVVAHNAEAEAWHIRVCTCGFPLGATLAVIRLVTCPDCGRRVVPVEDATRAVDVVAAQQEVGS